MMSHDVSAADSERNEGWGLSTYIARSTVPGAGTGLFAARPFSAGERLFDVAGPFYTIAELDSHPQCRRIREYAIAHRRGDGRLGAVSPLDLDGRDVEHRWGLMNEPPVLSLTAKPSLEDCLEDWLPDACGRWLVAPHVKSVHVYPNVALVARSSPHSKADAAGQSSEYGMHFAALRPIAQDEELVWCYGAMYSRGYQPSMAACCKGGWEHRWNRHHRGFLPESSGHRECMAGL